MTRLLVTGVDGADRLGPLAVVEAVEDPETGLGLGQLGMVRDVVEAGPGVVSVRLALAPAQVRSGDEISDAVGAALGELDGVERVEVRLEAMSDEGERHAAAVLAARQPKDPPFFSDGSTKVVLVSSGKGGVGKSTVAVNLACALATAGRRVGLLDADVWGYSVPRMLGASGDPMGIGEFLLPERRWGLRAVSIGFLADEASPVIWRGPMLHEAIEQFVSGVFWGDLDYLVVDMPPGTGDAAMSVASLVPGANVVVVTTPQEAASRVAERAGVLARRAELNLAGVVENMSGLVCSHCGHVDDVFGRDGGVELAGRLGVPLLGRVPLSAKARDCGDHGRPVVLDAPDDPAAAALASLAVEVERHCRAAFRKRLPFTVHGERAGGFPLAAADSGGGARSAEEATLGCEGGHR